MQVYKALKAHDVIKAVIFDIGVKFDKNFAIRGLKSRETPVIARLVEYNYVQE